MGKFLCPRGTSEAFCQGHQFGTLRLAAPKQGPNILLGQTVTLPIFGGWVSVGDPVGSSCQNVFFRPAKAGRCYALWVVAHLLLRAHSEAPESTRGAGNQLFLTVVPALASDARAFEPYLARSLGTMDAGGCRHGVYLGRQGGFCPALGLQGHSHNEQIAGRQERRRSQAPRPGWIQRRGVEGCRQAGESYLELGA